MDRLPPLLSSIVALVLVAFPAVSAAAETAGTNEAAKVKVEQFHEALLGVMKEAKTLGVRERYERLEPAVKETFSLSFMIRLATGTHWSKSSEEERERLTEAFERMSIATYADRFDGYSGESFETVGTRPGPQGTILVETRLVRPKDDPVDLVYVMRDVRGETRVVDVLLESGISELARYRSDYSKILRDHGVEGLVAELRHKTARMLGTDVAGSR